MVCDFLMDLNIFRSIYDTDTMMLVVVLMFIYLFFQGNEMKIQTIFESFEQFQLGRNSLDQLYSWIAAGLEKVCLVQFLHTVMLCGLVKT